MNSNALNGSLRQVSESFRNLLTIAGVNAPNKALIVSIAEEDNMELVAVQTVGATTDHVSLSIVQLIESNNEITCMATSHTINFPITMQELKRRVNNQNGRQEFSGKLGKDEAITVTSTEGTNYKLWTWTEGNDSWLSLLPTKTSKFGKKVTGKW